MNLKMLFWLCILAFVITTPPHSVFGDQHDMPERFVYTFKDAAPVKIYSGPVRFEHKRHVQHYALACRRCHHTLEEDDMDVQETCTDCHTEPGFIRGDQARDLDADELMEHYLNAVHAQCIDCHIETKMHKRDTKAPISCTRCHIRTTTNDKIQK